MSLIDNELNTAPIEAPVEPAAPAAAEKTGVAEQGNVGVTSGEWAAGEQVATLAEQSDSVIMKHMSEYMASPTQNLTINDTAIENAQDMADEMVMLLTMSEDDLLTANFTSPVAQMMQAKARAEADHRQDEEHQQNVEREEKRREAQEKWDEDIHSIGGEKYSGKQLHSMFQWLDNEDNANDFENQLMDKYKISAAEAKKRRMNAQDYLKLMEKERNGEALTDEEKRKKQELEPSVASDIKLLSEKVGVSGSDYVYKDAAVKNGGTVASAEKSVDARVDKVVDVGGAGTQTSLTLAKADYSDVTAPVIKAAPLTPAFQKAESSVVPLDVPELKKKAPQAVVAMATVAAPQAENATF